MAQFDHSENESQPNRAENPMYEIQFPVPEVAHDHSEKQGLNLVIALQGYADAGSAVTKSASHLLEAFEHHSLVVFNVDELVDYRSRRPATTIIGNEVVDIADVSLQLEVLRDSNGASFLLLSGPEPDMRWGAFAKAVADLVEKYDVARTISLYSAPMTVPHTRPLNVFAHGNEPESLVKFHTWDQNLSIPGAASLQIELELNRRGRKTLGMAAQVPHYIAANDYPIASLRLLEKIAEVSGLSFPLGALEQESERFSHMLADQVSNNSELAQVVSLLEQQYDSDAQKRSEIEANPLIASDGSVPSADELGAEFEKFLADQEPEDVEEEADDDGSAFNETDDEDPGKHRKWRPWFKF